MRTTMNLNLNSLNHVCLALHLYPCCVRSAATNCLYMHMHVYAQVDLR